MATICITPGCYFKIKPYERYCLCCRLDMDIEPNEAPPRGRPPGSVYRADGQSSWCVGRHHSKCTTCRCTCHQRVGAA